MHHRGKKCYSHAEQTQKWMGSWLQPRTHFFPFSTKMSFLCKLAVVSPWDGLQNSDKLLCKKSTFLHQKKPVFVVWTLRMLNGHLSSEKLPSTSNQKKASHQGFNLLQSFYISAGLEVSWFCQHLEEVDRENRADLYQTLLRSPVGHNRWAADNYSTV